MLLYNVLPMLLNMRRITHGHIPKCGCIYFGRAPVSQSCTNKQDLFSFFAGFSIWLFDVVTWLMWMVLFSCCFEKNLQSVLNSRPLFNISSSIRLRGAMISRRRITRRRIPSEHRLRMRYIKPDATAVPATTHDRKP